MSVWVEDTARNNLASWAEAANQSDLISGAVISPFCTPVEQNWKQGAQLTVDRLKSLGIEVWLDPQTHALQMPNVGFYKHYGTWDLWSGSVGELSSTQAKRTHVQKVFEAQDSLGLPHLAPTVLLHTPQSSTSEDSLELASIAVEEDPECYLSISGDSLFWAGGSALDAHIGALAQCRPAGWFVGVVRQLATLPVPASPDEVQGLCRTARALGEGRHLHVSHGDLAGLPSYAAGAGSIGTGWDARQKVCAYSNFEATDPESEGGGWFMQPTFEGLLSYLVRGDARTLENQNAELSRELLPGSLPPETKDVWLHHAAVMKRVMEEIDSGDYPESFVSLVDRYAGAAVNWPLVASELGKASQESSWVEPHRSGLAGYGRVEGF